MNGSSQFIATYANEIIALIIILAVVVLYLLIKPTKTSKIPKQKKVDVEVASDEVLESDDQKTDVKNEHNTPFAYKKISKKREMSSQKSISKDDFKIFEGLEIIVADDNAINQKVISSLLDGSGIKISLADNGQEVLNILETNHNVSMILMDAHMPVMDGFEAAKIIKQDAQYDELLIIALSGDVASDDILKMQNAGMQEHLEKPLKLDKLFEVFYTYTEDNEIVVNTTTDATTTCINVEEGIEICGGDLNLYKDILHEFTQSYTDIDTKISTNLVTDQLDDTARILLDISGIAANIGADTLATLATQYREAIKQHDELQYDSLNTSFIEELREVLKQIKNQK